MITKAEMGITRPMQPDITREGTWAVGGVIPFVVTFDSGRSVTIEIEFSDAPDERAAIRQCANKLNALAGALQALALRHMQ